jgi:succinate-semialdehyde dehydrogenase / glutarate-semialdehyde dehydrogenase
MIELDVTERTIEAVNPRTGTVDYRFTPPPPEAIAALCARLRKAQVAWGGAPLERRIAVLRRWVDVIVASADVITAAEVADTGRRRVAREVPHMVAGSIRGWCDKAPAIFAAALLEGESTSVPGIRYRTHLSPYPLLGVISPWNHPFLLSMIDAIPAMLAGCAVIVKPSEITPRFVDPVRATITQVPELAAILAYVQGDGATGQAIVKQVDALCFTGSVPTGRKIAITCAQRFIPCFLELGGKDAAIVTEDADIDDAAAAVLKGAVHNTGQLCFATERVYVAEAIAEPFVAALVDKANALEINWPDIGKGHLGPFIMPRQADIVDAHIDDALAKGAVLRAGGKSEIHDGGRYMRATVLTEVDHSMQIMTEETFGPVVPVMTYRDEDQALALANDSIFGLSGAVIAGSEAKAAAIAERMNAGGISLQDCSLTLGILRDAEKVSFGQSGLGGSRMGPNAITRFLRKKALIARPGAPIDMQALGEAAPAGAH